MKTANVSSITQLFHNTTMQSLIMRTPRLPLGTRYLAVFRISVQISLITPSSSSSFSKIYLTNSLKFKELHDIFVQRREMQIEKREKTTTEKSALMTTWLTMHAYSGRVSSLLTCKLNDFFLVRQIDDDDEGWVGRGVGWWVVIYLTYRVCQNQCDCLYSF